MEQELAPAAAPAAGAVGEQPPGATFAHRHIGPDAEQVQSMLRALGCESLQQLLEESVPQAILQTETPELPPALDEARMQELLARWAARNKVFKSLLGNGFYNTVMPAVIRRNVLENPSWYTAYTPYQSEISQGRLELLLNFQQLVSELCAMEVANASLLDEASAAAEALGMCRRIRRQGNIFFADRNCHPRTLAVLQTRARPLQIELCIGDWERELPREQLFGALLQSPGNDGALGDFTEFARRTHAAGALACAATDPLALVLLRPPGECGIDVVSGNSQRFGVPLGAGGPHAAFIATRREFQRMLPGRLVGVSKDTRGRTALRLSLQTREQHIRREKATSNICTAQVLPAILAACYALYHGPRGLEEIARRVHGHTLRLAAALQLGGIAVESEHFFDTLHFCPADAKAVLQRAEQRGYNLRPLTGGRIGISLDETLGEEELGALCEICTGSPLPPERELEAALPPGIPPALQRRGACLQHPVFSRWRSETELMRYLRRLAQRDIALDRSMIPLGSCTMKLNAAAEMEPISWPGFADIHPFAPASQTQGYRKLLDELEQILCRLTGFAAVFLQPNAGSQGEYAGLLSIRRYHRSRGEEQRDLCLIPRSAHGTNPASAALAGMEVQVVKCDARGDVDLEDLEHKAGQHAGRLAAVMLTYPSTHGVFEEGIVQMCRIAHRAGAQVYMDGANLNALLGIVRPADFGVDVCHFNLHKTFCIPHGGGGPGVGPIGVAEHLRPMLPEQVQADGDTDVITAAPWGSASILPISWAYLRMMGGAGLRRATEIAILNANYLALRLGEHYPLLYTGRRGRVAHECVFDLRPLRERTGVSEEDVAKRLIDFGYHAPTMSFPVPGTLMIEPTESESLLELERFCAAMIQIRREIAELEQGLLTLEDSPLKHAPHTLADLVDAEWKRPYSREQAFTPLPWVGGDKYLPPVNRVDNVLGEKQLFCGCPPLDQEQTLS